MKRKRRTKKEMASSNTKVSKPEVVKETLPQEIIVKDVFPLFTHEQLLQALYWIDDLMDRATVPYFLVYETAECAIAKKDLTGSGIFCGVRHNDWFTGTLGIVEAVATATEQTDNYFIYDYLGIPIKVFIFEDHPTIASPDTFIYEAEWVKVPNPYNEFIKVYPK